MKDKEKQQIFTSLDLNVLRSDVLTDSDDCGKLPYATDCAALTGVGCQMLILPEPLGQTYG